MLSSLPKAIQLVSRKTQTGTPKASESKFGGCLTHRCAPLPPPPAPEDICYPPAIFLQAFPPQPLPS